MICTNAHAIAYVNVHLPDSMPFYHAFVWMQVDLSYNNLGPEGGKAIASAISAVASSLASLR